MNPLVSSFRRRRSGAAVLASVLLALVAVLPVGAATAPAPLELLSWEPSRVGTPVVRTAPLGGDLVLVLPIAHIAIAGYTYQWYHNGVARAGDDEILLDLRNLQPADSGIYTIVATPPDGPAFHYSYIVGLVPAAKIVGAATEVLSDVRHPNGNVFDQVLLTGAHATVRADPGQVLRVSFIDPNEDIVQVELSGAGTLTVALAHAHGPTHPGAYRQAVTYMQGLASLTLVGADATTNLSVFSIGRLNAYDPTGAFDLTKPVSDTNDPARNGNPVFIPGFPYDGIADLASIAIGSTDGRFGALRCGNAHFFALEGIVGIYAPLVDFAGPFILQDLYSQLGSTPVLLTGRIGETGTDPMLIAGGTLYQTGRRRIQVGDAIGVRFLDGVTSHNLPLPRQGSEPIFTRYGVTLPPSFVVRVP